MLLNFYKIKKTLNQPDVSEVNQYAGTQMADSPTGTRLALVLQWPPRPLDAPVHKETQSQSTSTLNIKSYKIISERVNNGY